MGAGTADPDSISKDIIFPNYEWSELAKVQEKWNVTTFVVLSRTTIKSMDAGKSAERSFALFAVHKILIPISHSMEKFSEDRKQEYERTLYMIL